MVFCYNHVYSNHVHTSPADHLLNARPYATAGLQEDIGASVSFYCCCYCSIVYCVWYIITSNVRLSIVVCTFILWVVFYASILQGRRLGGRLLPLLVERGLALLKLLV